MNVGFARELMRRSVRNGEPGLLVGSRPATPLVFGGSNMSYADRARPALASMLMVLGIAGLAVLSVWPTTADAAVEGIEILAREPVAGGAVSLIYEVNNRGTLPMLVQL